MPGGGVRVFIRTEDCVRVVSGFWTRVCFTQRRRVAEQSAILFTPSEISLQRSFFKPTLLVAVLLTLPLVRC